jgi:hypothetical protein
MTGHFASWQLVRGGSGPVVHLALALQDGSLKATTGTAAPLDLAGVVVTIEVPLSFVTSSDSVSQELRFDFSTAGGAVASQSAVTVVGVALPAGSPIDSTGASFIGTALVQCIYNSKDSAGHVFATLIPNPIGLLPHAPQGGTQFYDPTTGSFNGEVLLPAGVPPDVAYYNTCNLPVIGAYAFTYTVSAGNTGSDYLTICSQAQITSEPAPATTSGLDPALVDFSSPACLGFSARYFLKYVLMPQLPAAYGLKPGHTAFGLYRQSPDIGRFSYQNNQVTNTDTIGLPSVSVNGISYDVQINHITFSIVGTQLKTALDGESDITSGVSVQFSYSCLNTASLNAAGQLVFAADPNPQTDHHISMSDTAKFENVLSADTLNLISNAVGDSIAHSTYNNLGDFGVTQLNPAFVQWTDYSLDTLTAVGLNDVFYAHGTGHIAPPAPHGGIIPLDGGGIIPLDNGGIHGGLTPIKVGG